MILVAYLTTCGSFCALMSGFLNGSMILRIPIFSNSSLHILYTHKFPIENNAILRGLCEGPLSLLTTSRSWVSAPCSIRSLQSVSEFLTKLPKAPAALALVFSSGSLSNSTSRGTQGLRLSYRFSLWKPAFPTAKQANFLVFGSGSVHLSIAALIRPFERSLS